MMAEVRFGPRCKGKQAHTGYKIFTSISAMDQDVGSYMYSHTTRPIRVVAAEVSLHPKGTQRQALTSYRGCIIMAASVRF
jgi:hypothetical protein